MKWTISSLSRTQLLREMQTYPPADPIGLERTALDVCMMKVCLANWICKLNFEIGNWNFHKWRGIRKRHLNIRCWLQSTNCLLIRLHWWLFADSCLLWRYTFKYWYICNCIKALICIRICIRDSLIESYILKLKFQSVLFGWAHKFQIGQFLTPYEVWLLATG